MFVPIGLRLGHNLAIRDGMLGAAQRPLAATPTDCLQLTRPAALVELEGAQGGGGGKIEQLWLDVAP